MTNDDKKELLVPALFHSQQEAGCWVHLLGRCYMNRAQNSYPAGTRPLHLRLHLKRALSMKCPHPRACQRASLLSEQAQYQHQLGVTRASLL